MISKRPRRRFTLAWLLPVLGGCSEAGVNCLDPGGRDWAVEVTVLDSTTGVPRADSALAVIRDRGYVDTLRLVGFYGSEPASLGGSNGRPGVYELTITRPGYATWTATQLMASEGACGLEGARVTAHLQPQ